MTTLKDSPMNCCSSYLFIYAHNVDCPLSILTEMASCVLVCTIIITCFLFISPSHVAASYLNIDGMKFSPSGNPQNVNLSIYYETLAPNCSNFIVQTLASVFYNDLISIINLELVPWGNAYIKRSNKTIVCKQGLDECTLNRVEACAINVWNDNVNKYYGLIYCIEFLAIEGRHKEWKTCFNMLGLPQKPVLDCFNGGNGTKFVLQYGYETAHLNPPRAFVPWVVVNNQPTREDYENLKTYVCKAYEGSAVPNACKPPSPNWINSAKKASLINATRWTFPKSAKRMSRFKHSSWKQLMI